MNPSTSPVLIVGFGSIGRRHLRNLRTLGCNNIVLCRTGASTLADDELAGLVVEYDLAKALRHQPVAAIISNPTALHIDVALAAAEAGCHLLIEKPVSHTLDGLNKLVHIVEKKGLAVLIGFQLRFHPGLQRIKSLVDAGAIGPIVSIQAHWGEYLPAWHPWEDYRQSYSARPELGGGVLLTLCHPFDYLRWLVGEVTEVSAMIGHSGGLDIPAEDTADIHLQFENGAIGHVHLDYVERATSHWVHVIGRQGSLHWENSDGGVRQYGATSADTNQYAPPAGFERNTLFLDEMRHFLACVTRTEEPVCTLNDGILALQIALAAAQSASEKQTVSLAAGRSLIHSQ